ncbi:MAG: ATP-binding protein [Rhodospirillaceae bacterium]
MLRNAAGIGAFIVLYVLLDRISLIEPAGVLGITPWNPSAGLSFALLLRYGVRFAPAVFAAVVLADVLSRELPLQPLATIAAALAITVGYAATAWLLRARLAISQRLDGLRDLALLIGVALAVTGIVAATVVTLFAATALLPWSDLALMLRRYWTGDVIGIAVLTPFLLLAFERGSRLTLPRPAAVAEYGLQLAAIGLGLWIIFGLERIDHFEYAYVLFLPLIWIALREGLQGATWGIVGTQVGLVAAVQVKGYDADVMGQFQLLMLAVAVTGLALGAVVDQRRRAEQSLRESEARLQTVVSTAPDAILTADPDGAVLSANAAGTEMFGLGPDTPPDLRLAALLPDVRLDDPAPIAGRETTAQRTDGTRFVAEVSMGRAAIDDRPLLVAVVRDVSARKRDEARLRQHEAELAHAGRLSATGEMAAALAHELNQPLTALISFARAGQAVLEAGAAAQASRLIDQAVEQATRAGAIIRTTRAFLKSGESGHESIDVAQLFAAVQNLVRAEAAYNSVHIAMHVEPGLPPVLVDAIQIEQVILNLIRNSIEAMDRADSPRRDITIVATASDDPREVEVAVTDTGPGIAAEVADRLFTPFATTKQTGMGLGLSISRTIVHAHRGRIWSVPRPCGGAELRFTLPVDAGDEYGN